MEKYNGKYRIPSARRPNWDYRSAGAYFITICTQDREHFFGEIADGKMHYSNIGIIADILWGQIPYHDHHVELGEFVVMPNHVHGILILSGTGDCDDNRAAGNSSTSSTSSTSADSADSANSANSAPPASAPAADSANSANFLNSAPPAADSANSAPPAAPPAAPPVQTLHATSLQGDISPKPHSISTIIRSYKSAVTRHAHRYGFDFQWQARFHDIIIRDDQSFQNISQYIINKNPANWREDKFRKSK